MNTGFLPITKEELISQGIQRPDFVYVIGDAYVDHPSFGHAIISRVLHAHGYSVGIIALELGEVVLVVLVQPQLQDCVLVLTHRS